MAKVYIFDKRNNL